MKPLLLVLALACSTTASAEAPRAPGEAAAVEALESFQQHLFDQAAPSVVVIKQGGSLGSGFFVTADGLVLTNRHVVGSKKQVKVETHDGRKLVGEVVELAEERLDLALVKVEGGPFTPLAMAPMAKLRIGSWVATIGHGYGGAWTFTTGMISNIYPVGEDEPIVQTQIPVNPGNSGGPILDKEGRAVAVVTAKVQGGDNVNLSIRMDVAFKSLQRLADACACLVIRTPPDVPVFVDGLLVGKGPRVLLPVAPGAHEVMVPVEGGQSKTVTFPDTKLVDLGRGSDAGTAAIGAEAREQAMRIARLDLEAPAHAGIAPGILSAWIGQTVTLELKDLSRVFGQLTGFRPPATLKVATSDDGDRFISLWDIRWVQRH